MSLSSDRARRFATGSDTTEVTCPDTNSDPLGFGNAGTDLVVKGGTCVVDGSTPSGEYMYHNINIVKGGVLQFNDAKIDLYAANIIIENKGTMRAGTVDPNTGVITPIAGPLTIHLYGANQGPGGAGAPCKTDATCGVPNKDANDIWQSNASMTMYPSSCKETKGLPGGVDDCFYKYDAMPFDNGKPLDSTFDQKVGYYGYKVLGVGYGATLQLYGKKGATYDTTVDPANTGTSWVRLNNCNPSGGRSVQAMQQGRAATRRQHAGIVETCGLADERQRRSKLDRLFAWTRGAGADHEGGKSDYFHDHQDPPGRN